MDLLSEIIRELHSIEVPLIKLCLSLLLGALIGAEREYKSKVAGFRTIILITLGSTLFTLVSVALMGQGDPTRIASTIVTGIGFLGAGVIYRETGTIKGITTAAVIWAAAAIGMMVGFGLFAISIISVILILIILLSFSWLQRYIDRTNREKVYRIHLVNNPEHIQTMKQNIKSFKLSPKIINQGKRKGLIYVVIEVEGPVKFHNNFMKSLYESDFVESFEV
ncbi:MgtC/SapB family protein [Cytophaga hutchinsonii]|jgi:putative Mg2+ transporter-C (MgtC) family protein|uniref:MgtC family protein n=1 Tax=Cytophaga hutchinsonii (strain ATCC 33406 / DSM 1761 / CIP 103989 / NBRC 15051 / NCIMB 9469 / D465) TaxID=269798 RepID=A0A6N4SW71_CYTH3|nr:MgtC/SapB family protein [Cytophaga hutchinsonii]ABG60845.1 MgtC family protein [Cytophaga hutchinsonii ATCC 33406]SFX73052.1 putative Mg2+ transporter-C (MgtC) family protein [Cytophaga hutchinsonii ATCC 33406]